MHAAVAIAGAVFLPVVPASAQRSGGRGTPATTRSAFDLGRIKVGLRLTEIVPELEKFQAIDIGVQKNLSSVEYSFERLMIIGDRNIRAIRRTQQIIERNQYFLTGATIRVDAYAPGDFTNDQIILINSKRHSELINNLSPIMHPVHHITITAHVGGLDLQTDRVIALATSHFGQPAWRIDQLRSSIGVARGYRDRLVTDAANRTDKVTLAWGGLRRPRQVQQYETFNSFDDVLLGLPVRSSELPGESPGQRLQVISQNGQALGIMLDYLDTASACLPPARRR